MPLGQENFPFVERILGHFAQGQVGVQVEGLSWGQNWARIAADWGPKNGASGFRWGLASRPNADHFKRMQNMSSLPVLSLAHYGWSSFFSEQLEEGDGDLTPMRIATIHRDRMSAECPKGQLRLVLPHRANTADYAVGDWVLVNRDTAELGRRLTRNTELSRTTEGGKVSQLIAANVDTLFIVTSCNEDMNIARLERYLALANASGTRPVVVLTKADKVADAEAWRAPVLALQRGLEVVTLNGTEAAAKRALSPWCAMGQTVALVGSSGVGKSTLLNTLTEKTGEDAQLTGGIREHDAKGRHTTTSRSLHMIPGGAVVIDTPGIRNLYLADVTAGLDLLFAEIVELAPDCRFRNCTHMHEPGCAVQAAVKEGALDADRLERWRKLQDESVVNMADLTAATERKAGKKNKYR